MIVSKKANSGFSLIELLVGITILVIIVTTVYASFQIGLKTYRTQEQKNYLHQNIRLAWRMISRDLRCAFKSENKDLKFEGEENKVTFVTYLPEKLLKSSALSKVRYYIDDDPLTPYEGLVKEVYGFPISAPNEDEDELAKKSGKIIQIAPKVESLKLKYYNGEDWFNSWDKDEEVSENKIPDDLPMIIEIQIGISSNENPDELETFTTTVPIYSSGLVQKEL